MKREKEELHKTYEYHIRFMEEKCHHIALKAVNRIESRARLLLIAVVDLKEKSADWSTGEETVLSTVEEKVIQEQAAIVSVRKHQVQDLELVDILGGVFVD